MSKDKYSCLFLKPNGCYCVNYPSNIFLEGRILGDLLSRLFFSAQNIISLLKVFSFIRFNNLLGIKAKRAHVNRRVPKLWNITWGIFNNYSPKWR